MIIGFFFVLLLVIASAPTAVAQLRLSGRVTDSHTGEPVEQSQVRVGSVATYTNSEGNFMINIPKSTGEPLQVFQMGYAPFRTNKLRDSTYNIQLVPETVGETISDSLSGEEVMQEVFLRFFTNYEYKDQLVTSYYKERLMGGDEMYYFADEVLEMYLPADINNAPPLAKPVKSRVRYLKPFPSRGVSLTGGGPTEMIQSAVRVNNSFLAPENRWNYRYTLSEKQMHRDELVYVIDFEPANGKGYLAGRIYVDQYLFAIIKLEYFYVKDENKRWTEEFQHDAYTYYLYRASFEDQWEAKGEKFVFSSMLMNTKIITDQENMDLEGFVSEKAYGTAEVSEGNFTNDYWGEYNYLLLTEKEAEVLSE